MPHCKLTNLDNYFAQFAGLEPFSGYVPRGFFADFLGTLTDASFRARPRIDPAQEVEPADPMQEGGTFTTTAYPRITQGEGFFEAVSWFEAAREARGSYTMVTLGACYGSQAVSAYHTLQRINPMPAKLVAVEAEPENFAWMQRHFRYNGIDPHQHWLMECALSDSYRPALFPVGLPGTGTNNCYATNYPSLRAVYADMVRRDPDAAERLYNLILEGDTGIERNVAFYDTPQRVKFVSAVPLSHVLAPLELVDLLEVDIQQSEVIVFPPAMEMVKTKVKRVHIGTHGDFAHDLMLQEFATRRFEIIFDYEGDRIHKTPLGSLRTSDGIIGARNMDL